MSGLQYIVLGLCVLWALGGAAVMSQYGGGMDAGGLVLESVIDFGPLLGALAWIFAKPRRPS